LAVRWLLDRASSFRAPLDAARSDLSLLAILDDRR